MNTYQASLAALSNPIFAWHKRIIDVHIGLRVMSTILGVPRTSSLYDSRFLWLCLCVSVSVHVSVSVCVCVQRSCCVWTVMWVRQSSSYSTRWVGF